MNPATLGAGVGERLITFYHEPVARLVIAIMRPSELPVFTLCLVPTSVHRVIEAAIVRDSTFLVFRLYCAQIHETGSASVDGAAL